MSLPEEMLIVRDRDFARDHLDDYIDEVFFRLYHGLSHAEKPMCRRFHFRTVSESDIGMVVNLMNRSYTDISVDNQQMAAYRQSSVFRSDLWLLAVDDDTCEAVGCGIADVDDEAGEMSLEWIQVLPSHRRRGIGKALVCYYYMALRHGRKINPLMQSRHYVINCKKKAKGGIAEKRERPNPVRDTPHKPLTYRAIYVINCEKNIEGKHNREVQTPQGSANISTSPICDTIISSNQLFAKEIFYA